MARRALRNARPERALLAALTKLRGKEKKKPG